MLRETEMQEKYQKDASFRAYVDRYASGYQSGGDPPRRACVDKRL